MTAQLAALPPVPTTRLAVRVTADALRQIRGGHPWVYAEAILSPAAPDPALGTLGVVFDDRRRFVGIGLWDPDSPIRLRLLHHGRPTPIDAEFFAGRVTDAVERRGRLEDQGTTGYRIVNGENDGLGGLIVDRYGSTVVVKVYTAAWFPHLPRIVEALGTVLSPERIVLRLGRGIDTATRHELGVADGLTLVGTEPEDHVVEFREHGLLFGADPWRGQKTGYFLDQRENRRFVSEHSAGAHVLDLFCCGGGFGVQAAAGGAASIHSVDASAHAIREATANMARNATVTGGARHRTTVGDAFEVLADLEKRRDRYDVIVIDPPAFASRRRDRDAAIRAYRKLTELSLPLLRSGGRLFQCSCSSHVNLDDLVGSIRAALRGNDRVVDSEQTFGHAVDHPVTFPQGRYLDAWTGVVR